MEILAGTRPKKQVAFLSVIADTFFIALGYLLYTRVPYWSSIPTPESSHLIGILAILMAVCSAIWALADAFSENVYVSGSYRAFLYVGTRNSLFKKDLLAVCLKMIYIPLMLSFCINNFQVLSDFFKNLLAGNIHFSAGWFFNFIFIIYPFLVTVCFFVDTLWFLVGYLVASPALGNQIKSVDSTWTGWAVALVCYPPLNMLLGKITPPHGDYPFMPNETGTFVLRIVMLALLVIYTTATVNLGWKCSNLTNRGIVSHGVYGWVRHPAYVAKNLFWWLSLLPMLPKHPEWIPMMSVLTLVYVLRALTEEKHLSKDPYYLAYRKKVKYRFIPKVI